MKKISQVKCEELRYRMFTEKNFGGDRLPSTFDELVLDFFLNSFSSLIKHTKYDIENSLSMHEIPL